MQKSYLIYPLLFAIFPILFLWAHNISEATLAVFLIPAASSICFVLLLWLLFAPVFKDKRKTGLMITLVLLLFFSYGHFFSLIENLTTWGVPLGKHGLAFFIWGILFASGTYFIVKIERNLDHFTSILNAIAIFLIIIPLASIVIYKTKTNIALKNWESMKKMASSISSPDLESPELASFPDIYYIVLDRYTNQNVLKEFYNYDNSEFINYLTDKDFYIASESYSNYPKTFLSLASSLNLEYLNYLTEIVGEESSDEGIVYQMLEDYKVWRFLKSKRYKFIHFGSWWEPTSKNRYADINFNYFNSRLCRFLPLLLKTTIFNPFIAENYYASNEERRSEILSAFKKLAEMPDVKGPKFVFAHLLIPHSPYIFDENGELLTERESEEKSVEEKYISQLIFTNKKIANLVDEILAKSKVQPIIILQGDEGPMMQGFHEYSIINYSQLSSEIFKQKMGILNAYFLPDFPQNVLYPSITPVNSFRLIFNFYFGTDYKLLEDKIYTFEDANHPYKFIEITDKIRNN